MISTGCDGSAFWRTRSSACTPEGPAADATSSRSGRPSGETRRAASTSRSSTIVRACPALSAGRADSGSPGMPFSSSTTRCRSAAGATTATGSRSGVGEWNAPM